MSPLTPTLAELNDRFRSMIQIPQFGDQEIRGTYLITRGIAELSPEDQIEIIAKVRNFDTFNEANDPFGDHSFGDIDHPGVGKILWKIDIYDATMTFGAEDPMDVENSVRVLTIMLPLEW